MPGALGRNPEGYHTIETLDEGAIGDKCAAPGTQDLEMAPRQAPGEVEGAELI
jgi:hypothetical protein